MAEVGRRVRRVDAVSKVTGAARYVDDLSFPGMLVGRVVRSPYPHARIKGVSLEKAKALPGVHAVLTHSDIPGKNIVPIVFDDQPCLASDEVRYVGEAVALIAAETHRAAEEAASLVEIDYEELPAVFEPGEALDDSTPPVNPVLGKILSHHRVRSGDIEEGFREAEVVVEGEFRTAYQDHAYLETQGMIALINDTGGVEVYGSMQCPFYVQKALAYLLGIDWADIRVVQAVTGGGFGGKEDAPSLPAAHAALLSWATRRPVKLVFTREEDIVTMTKRHPGIVRIRYGAKRDGTLTACDVDYTLNGGAWATLSPIVLWRGTIHAMGPYRIPHVRVETRAVATNTVPNGAFRGFGQPQVAFANESLMDELAVKLGIEPYELRRKNALTLGDTTPSGKVLDESCGMEEVTRRVAEEFGWNSFVRSDPDASEGVKARGKGCSFLFYGTGLGAAGRHIDRAGAFLQVDADGSVQIAVGTTEMGQGHLTVLSQIAAEELGTMTERVSPLPVDTSRVPDSGPTVASRGTIMSGGAVKDAARAVRERIHAVVAERWGVEPDRIEFETGKIRSGEKEVSFDEAVSWAVAERVNLSHQGFFKAPHSEWDGETGRGDAYYVYTFSANMVEVEVDRRTGVVEVKRIVSGHDIGKAINPGEAEGQIQGGVTQGLGYAIYEDLRIRDGRFERPNLSGYTIPGTLEIPEITPIIVEDPYSKGAFGCKGLGEPPLIGIAPAVANAVYDAVGVRPTRTPILPEEILDALREKEEGR